MSIRIVMTASRGSGQSGAARGLHDPEMRI
jgi:hypothetical protein